MNGSECFHRDVREEAVAFIFTDQVGEFVVAPVYLVTSDEAPFADVDPFVGVVRAPVGEGVTVDDVLGEDVADGLDAGVFALGFEKPPVLLREVVQEPFPAGCGVVGEDLDAVDAGDCPDGVMLVLELGILPGFDAGLADRELAAENLDEEVPVTARWLQETGVDPLRLRLHKVEHRIHLTEIREHLTVSRHPFLGLDLGGHSALSLGICVLFGKAVTYGHKNKA